ncbi:3-hydroxyisobutyrate dehydrogenase [Sphingobacterium nematocida]|uniref:3-hydroxyisobutyrate dehydrogenase n=1 Tax=Sphingobacterium nematocida TaxID=1513896 RepID=A0A1T5EJ02_9SPHI|nr:NAD(P)-binding domain-containing protein [Sphingobacterium nematocida]SKB83877.1 3-hydroxyisobutyrate dehydrogenase [Sphingobacterium nematocida]
MNINNIKTETPRNKRGSVTVLGLGNMGASIAHTFINQGYDTVVWNRNTEKCKPLIQAGAATAETLGGAVSASKTIVICLLNNTAVDELLRQLTGSVAGKVFINLTSGTPAQARDFAEWADTHNASYIDGKILADPVDIGTSKSQLLFSGKPTVFDAQYSLLEKLGAITYYGEDAGAAAVDFLAQVTIGYEFLIGFLHTLQLVHKEGVDLAAFAHRVAGTLQGYGPLLSLMVSEIQLGTFKPDLGPLQVQAAMFDDLIGHRESQNIETVRMREIKSLMDRRIDDGHGDQGFSSLFELLGKQ